MAKKIRVGLVFGGESAEHEISLRSAETVAKLLDHKQYSLVSVKIEKNGKWSIKWDELPRKVDVIFPCLHGPRGEDGTVQGLFELLNVPYVGCGVLASALGMDKSIQKRLLKEQGIPVLESYTFEAWYFKREQVKVLEEIAQRFSFPIFVKPCRLGSSIGIHCVQNEDGLQKAICDALQYDTKVIVEPAVVNAREFEVALLGNEISEVSVVGETIPANPFLDFEAKYKKPSTRHIPAKIPSEIAKKIQSWAQRAYVALDCKGFARVDFLAKPDLTEIYLGEINTIPGLTPTSMFLKLWEATGKKPVEVMERLIQLAIKLHKQKVQ